MSKRIVGLLAAVLIVSAFYGVQASAAKDKVLDPSILEFKSMIGVPLAYTGTRSPIREINGGGAPWVVESAKGELKQSGKLEITVGGLVLQSNGNNPVAMMKAIVSCQSVDAGGNASMAKAETGLFTATTGLASAGGGNVKIEANVVLPQPCIAPIIFVTAPSGAWFAATGF